ncbi:MAG: hypothetical protein WKF77_12365, partial [Planctomycetaceae bacterium]
LADEEGLIGRECPVSQCEGYFKIKPGTGLKGKNLPCHCPYCGHQAIAKNFYTKAQIAYAKSVVLGQVSEALIASFKSLEFHQPPSGRSGIGISLQVTGAKPVPIRYYREKDLETNVVCDRCTLRYTIYGVFGFCPDCAVHNSLQILKNNLQLIEKILDIATTHDANVGDHLVENALEDCVSTFDGFGRETCRVFASKAVNPSKAAQIKFQNISGARDRVRDQFGFDFSACLAVQDWDLVHRAFQKRHLLAHSMGVIDADYLSSTGDASVPLGRKVSVNNSEVHELVQRLLTVGGALVHGLESLP